MTGAVGDHHLERGLDFAMDRFAMNVHGNATSHIDALCHVIFDSKLYNDVPVDVITPTGATSLSIDVVRERNRRSRCAPRHPPTTRTAMARAGRQRHGSKTSAPPRTRSIFTSGRVICCSCASATVPGERSSEPGTWRHARAGLHPTALEFVAERKIAALGSDSNNDTAPSTVEGVDFPVHALAMNALGIHLLDYLQFEDLAAVCEQQDRWTFLAVIAPLRLPAATGSPINPIAIL